MAIVTDLLMLGIIPGTHIQITFGMWLATLAVLLVPALVYGLVTSRNLRAFILYLSIARAIRRA